MYSKRRLDIRMPSKIKRKRYRYLLCFLASLMFFSFMLLILVCHVELTRQQQRQKIEHMPEIVQVQNLLTTMKSIMHNVLTTKMTKSHELSNDIPTKEQFLRHLYDNINSNGNSKIVRKSTLTSSSSSSFSLHKMKPKNDQLIAFYLSSFRYLQRWKKSLDSRHTTTAELKLSLKTTTAISLSSSTPRSPTTGDATISLTTAHIKEDKEELINMIRIPKAGSSSLSIIGRALSGCKPDGWTCCQRPYDLCPFRSTVCPSVRGCIDHEPNYTTTAVPESRTRSDTHTYGVATEMNPRSKALPPLITQIRHPAQRLFSGYFHPQSGIHNNNKEKCRDIIRHTSSHRNKSHGHWDCFTTHYIEQAQFQNILTKMLLGWYPYNYNRVNDTRLKDQNVVQLAQQRLCTFEWFGILEMPILSNLLLYESGNIFPTLVPHPTVFGLPPVTLQAMSHNDNDNDTDDDYYQNLQMWLKYNHGDGGESKPKDKLIRNSKAGKNRDEYISFLHGDYMDRGGEALIAAYNKEDYDVYDFALKLFCTRVYEAGLHLLSNYFVDRTYFQQCHTILFYDIPKNNTGEKANDDDPIARLLRSSEELCTF